MSDTTQTPETRLQIQGALVAVAVVGLAAFAYQLWRGHPDQAWQAYLINFLVFSAMAQGALVFSAMMHTAKARWTGPLSGLAESFSAFFPVSLILFIPLVFGGAHVFPWLDQDLHGKEVWLNLPFLFGRDFLAMVVLYLLGFAYLYTTLQLRIGSGTGDGRLRRFLDARWARGGDPAGLERRKSVLAIVYLIAFAVILSLLGYDLVMATDPHWYSTLFGAYTFIKAVYLGLAGLLVMAAVAHLNPRIGVRVAPGQFHDLGKLFFAFCLVWADFFYCQFVVIWYGNIPEEASYLIERVLHPPWQPLAWGVLLVGFVMPFFILLNQRIKTRPLAMLVICVVATGAMWFEHYLLVGPALNAHADRLHLVIPDLLITLGFAAVLMLAVGRFWRQFPEVVAAVPTPAGEEAH